MKRLIIILSLTTTLLFSQEIQKPKSAPRGQAVADTEIAKVESDAVFSAEFPQIVKLLKSKEFSNEKLLEKMNAICLTPPNSISYKEFVQFQSALKKYADMADSADSLTTENAREFMYSFAELTYYISNAIAKSAMNLMMESILEGRMVEIDIFKVVEGAQNALDIYMVMILDDDESASRNKALNGVDRIMTANPLSLSKKWTNGEEIRGINVISLGVPVNLDRVDAFLQELDKSESDASNKELIAKIQKRIKSI
jgi:hypothetical protein